MQIKKERKNFLDQDEFRNDNPTENFDLTSLVNNTPLVRKMRSTDDNNFYEIRPQLVEWLYLINFKLRAHPNTLFRAIDYLDNFINSTMKEIPRGDFHLYAAVSYFIAHKLEEVVPFNLKFLSKEILKSKFSEETIIITEQEVLKEVNFLLQRTTVQQCTEIILQKLQKEELSGNAFLFNIMLSIVNDLQLINNPLEFSIVALNGTYEMLEKTGRVSKEEVRRYKDQLEKLINELFPANVSKILELGKSLWNTVSIRREGLLKTNFSKQADYLGIV